MKLSAVEPRAVFQRPSPGPPAPALEEVLERGAERGKVQLAWGEPLTKLLQLGTYEDSFYLKDLLRPSTAQTKHKQIGNRDAKSGGESKCQGDTTGKEPSGGLQGLAKQYKYT